MSSSRPQRIPDHDPTSPEAVRARVDTLFREHYTGLCGFVVRYVRSRAVAEEIVQELFLWIWERLEAGDLPAAPLAADVSVITRAYLYAAARNRAISVLRREQLERRYTERQARDVDTSERTVHEDVEDAELAHAARRAIAALPEKCRLVFTLNRQQGLTYAEIAQVLGVSVKAVEANMTRALKALRVSLGNITIVSLVVSIQSFLGRH
jgi:RNA polymerase sigma-70 factor (ECF subfamily)